MKNYPQIGYFRKNFTYYSDCPSLPKTANLIYEFFNRLFVSDGLHLLQSTGLFSIFKIQAIVKLNLTGLLLLEQQLNGNQNQNQESATTLNLILTNPQSTCTSKLNKTISFVLLLSKLFWMMEETQHTIFPCQAFTIIRVNQIRTNTLLTNQQNEKTKNK